MRAHMSNRPPNRLQSSALAFSMNHRKEKQRILLTIELPETVGDEPDGFQRLRKFLKALLRVYRIRCVAVGRPEDKIIEDLP